MWPLSTCTRTLIDAYISVSMIMKFCIWTNDESQFRILVQHVHVHSYNSWCTYVFLDDNDFIHLSGTMILNFRTTCTARSRVLHDNLTILRVVMEHVHVHMYGTTFSALVLWRSLTESHRIYEPPVLLYFSESWPNSCMTAYACTVRNSMFLCLYGHWRNTGMMTLTWTAWNPHGFILFTGHGVSIVRRT